ncbi:class I SAM-dependent methyltransferase [Prosthecobacter sp. SYSU 5D2]|uniref:O-methyltransferase n=1 Tax=Prosthecobacter sp. SYSU 5D2 TaxID=3134134 RepID=UPI0031FE7CF5
MHGFKKVLEDWLLKVKPKRILEWGPGLSTEIMLDHAPGAQVLSIEHHEGYYAKANQSLGERVRLVHLRADIANSSYATFALDEGPFDLVFVDGRRRVECVMAALHVLSPGGVILLHDFCRLNYQRLLLPLCELVEIRDNTAVFKTRLCP